MYAHENLFDGFLCTMTFVPRGASLVDLNLNLPYKYACADRFGLLGASIMRFKVKRASSSRRFHYAIRKLGSNRVMLKGLYDTLC